MKIRLSSCLYLTLFIIWFLELKCIQLVEMSADSFESWPLMSTELPRLERVSEGKDITLRCIGSVEDSMVYWDYKPCGNSSKLSCGNVINNKREGIVSDEWTFLPHTKRILSLTNVLYTDSGLYRCREATSTQVNVYSTTELEVISYRQDQDSDVPQFVDNLPPNIHVGINNQEVFQCKVSSRSLPTIIWLQEGPGPFNYQGKSYILINSSGEMELSENVYLSKMIIHKVLPSHAGRYYCLAMNTKGFSNTSTLLSVDDFNDNLNVEYYSKTYSVYYLFLIPVALALVPVTIWLCFFCFRTSLYTAANVNKEEEGSIDITFTFSKLKPVHSNYYGNLGRAI